MVSMNKKKKYPVVWDLSSLGSSYCDSLFTQEREQHEKKIKAFARKWQCDQSYLSDMDSLLMALDEYRALSELFDREGMYLFLARQVDSLNPRLAAAEKKYTEHEQVLADELRFFPLALSRIDAKMQKKILKNKELFFYWKFLSNLFENVAFNLSEKEERILSLKSGVSRGNWVAMVEEIFSKEKRIILTMGEKGKRVKQEKTFNEILSLINAPCSRVRKSAAAALEDIFEQHRFVVEKEFNSFLEDKKINDELRGYTRPDQARIISDDVSFEIVDTLSTTVSEYFSLSAQYYKLKAALLGKDVLSYHERNIPAVKGAHKEVSYDESVELVHRALLGIDPHFAEIHQEMVESGKVDVYPRAGKRGGAFCMYHDKKLPVYIMLNHTNELRDVATLAHEMGHAIHGTLAKREDSFYYGTPTFMAEIASTFCESFAFDLMQEGLTKKQRLSLLMNKLGDDVSTIMRQIAAYNFEREIHALYRERGYLSSDEIGKVFSKHMKSYMGKAVLQNDGAPLWWMYWSHLRSPFYVYSYASGLLLAKGMRALLKSGDCSWEELKEFFYTGESKSPKEVFVAMGIDLTRPEIWRAGLNEMKDMLKEAKKLAKDLGKI